MASEDFTGAAAALSGSWSQQRTIATGTVNKNGSGVGVASVNLVDVFAFWNADPFSNDQSSQLTIAGGLSSTMWAYATVRASGTTDATFNNYTFFTNGLTGTGNTAIARWVNGVQTEILALATTFTTGDVMRIQAVGSRISAYKNGVLLGTVTDANLPTGAPGCGMFGNTVTIDNWSGGNLAGAGVLGTRRVFGGRSRIRSINTPSGPFDRNGFLRQRVWDYTLMASTPAGISLAIDASTETSADAALTERIAVSAVASSDESSSAVNLLERDVLAIGTSDETSSAASFSQRIVAAIATVDEAFSAETFAERIVFSVIASVDEASSAENMLERDVLAISTSDETFSNAVISQPSAAFVIATNSEDSSDQSVAERIVAAVATSDESKSDSVLSEAVAISLSVATSSETRSDAQLSTPIPDVVTHTVSGGKPIHRDGVSSRFLDGIDPASYVFDADTLKTLRKPRREKKALVEAEAWSLEKEAREFELMAVFAAVLDDED